MKITADEVGYLPYAPKKAVSDGMSVFKVIDVLKSAPVSCDVQVKEYGMDDNSGETVWQIDFSDLQEPGSYCIEAQDGSRSAVFKIEPHVYRTMKNAMLKAFYFQRCGMDLEPSCASVFAHPACHLQSAHLYEDPSVTMEIRGGWHDAGDFGRYTTAAAVAVAHLLYAYERFPEAFTESVNLPESGNGIPDLLNECYYELDFLMQLQAADGGVYHKITTERHADFMMPQEDHAELIVYPVSSMATADFAAVMSLASRVYADYDPVFARDAMHCAADAGQWLAKHPDFVNFHNPDGCNTGEYGDDCDLDERLWAFSELLRTDYEIRNENDHSMMAGMPQKMSRQKLYQLEVSELLDQCLARDLTDEKEGKLSDGFGWSDVSSLAALALLFDERMTAGAPLLKKMAQNLYAKADRLLKLQEENGYLLAMKPQDFIWGSNMVVTNRADLLITAALFEQRQLDMDDAGVSLDETALIKVIEYSIVNAKQPVRMSKEERKERLQKKKAYETAALEQLHYLTGRNAMDISYVTGIGEHAFSHPHNRPSSCDGIERAIPGQVSGGPCCPPLDDAGRQLVPEGSAPMKCYADDERCYSLNEITIYWNSSALFMTAFFDRI